MLFLLLWYFLASVLSPANRLGLIAIHIGVGIAADWLGVCLGLPGIAPHVHDSLAVLPSDPGALPGATMRWRQASATEHGQFHGCQHG